MVEALPLLPSATSFGDEEAGGGDEVGSGGADFGSDGAGFGSILPTGVSFDCGLAEKASEGTSVNMAAIIRFFSSSSVDGQLSHIRHSFQRAGTFHESHSKATATNQQKNKRMNI